MGLFKKKKNAVIVKTFLQALNHEMKIEDDRIVNYQRLKSKLPKFLTAYQKYFNNYAHIYGDTIQLQFKKDYEDYPDGFFALADKLGLNIEPCCTSGGFGFDYADYYRSFNVKVKSK